MGAFLLRALFPVSDHLSSKRKMVGAKGFEPTGLDLEAIANEIDKIKSKPCGPQYGPQEKVTSCPDLATVVMNWGFLRNTTKDAILELVRLGGKGADRG